MRGIVSIIALLALATGPALANTITYQGQLEQSGTPFTGTARFIFALAEDEQSAAFETLDPVDVEVVDGLFQVELQFSEGAFASTPRWLEVSVDGTLLGDRQKVTAVPFSLRSTQAGGDSNWSVSGSDITFQGGNVGIGVADPARRLQVSGSVIFGRPGNSASIGDAFVSGGLAFETNSAGGQSSFVGGGFGNATSATAAFVGGGRDNTASGTHSFVAGGRDNIAEGSNSFIAGGVANRAEGASAFAAGTAAKALHDRSFVWSDGVDANFQSTDREQFLVSAFRGIGINWSQPQATLDIMPSPFFFELFQPHFIIRSPVTESPIFSIWETSIQTSLPIFSDEINSDRIRLGSVQQINGDAVCVNNNRVLGVCGQSSANSKRAIKKLDQSEASDLLRSLRPVRFEWIDDTGPDIGFIAEEVAVVIPEIARTNAEGVVTGLKYDRLSPLLVAGFQEQSAYNAQRFAALESDHQRLAVDNTRLKTAQQDLARENAELRAEVAVLKVQSGQVRELERRLAVMEERERENDDLRARLAALESVLLDHGQIARTER